jgi:ribosome-associated protein
MADAFLTVPAVPPLRIPRAELSYRATRAGGPGGQHVNTSATRVELTWNVATSVALTDAQRALLCERLAARLRGGGVLRIVASEHRSQHRNREEADERLCALLGRALARTKPRRPTRPPRASREARLEEKKRRAEIKRGRGRVDGES